MESTIVIKVKYGDTLRRFNANIVDKDLALDMNQLREKVLSLFSFPTDSELTLTYIDEDGDVVTLADEEDLHDIMRQSLNPLRITVRLNTEMSSTSHSRSNGNSTPMRSPKVPPPLQIPSASVSEILKSVPLAIRETLLKLSTELESNTSSSPPGYAELLDSLSKMGLNYLKEVSVSSTDSGPSESIVDAPVTKGENSSKSDGTTPVAELKSNEADHQNLPGFSEGFVMPAADLPDLNDALESKSNEPDKRNSPGSSDGFVMPAAYLPDLNDAFGGNKLSVGYTSANPAPGSFDVAGAHKKDKAKKLGKYNASGSYNGGSFVGGNSIAINYPSGDKMKEIKKSIESHLDWKPVGVGSLIPNDYPNSNFKSLASDQGGFTRAKVAADSGNSSGSQFGFRSSQRWPFTGLPIDNYSSHVLGHQFAPQVTPFKRSCNHSDGINSIFHRGVRCDGCGVHPITGPRFKSKVKENYDLCSICFADMGNEADYIRMNRPMIYQHPVSSKSFYDPMQHSLGHPPTLQQVLRSSAGRSKLDSRFIKDVNIPDGAIMAPSTPFTKIWRMRNNGTVVWPRGAQLLWIGGDRFSKTVFTDLKIPADGCPVDKEIDIAVDFSAPEHPGRYISYWRMASPSGQKFGQRVWVLIQVDASFKDSFGENAHGFNLNLPPVSSGLMGSKNENVSVEPMIEDGLLLEADSFNMVTELVEPVVDASLYKDQDLNFPINDTLLVGGAIPNPSSPEASIPVTYPAVDFSKAEPVATSPAQTSNTDVTSSVVGVSSKDEIEQSLLTELEEMGFKLVDLNKEILRMNEFNLEQSVDDLCDVEEWDPILKELQEMGFSDKEMNKMLLKKNNGSIKRVVMDLIAGEKA